MQASLPEPAAVLGGRGGARGPALGRARRRGRLGPARLGPRRRAGAVGLRALGELEEPLTGHPPGPIEGLVDGQRPKGGVGLVELLVDRVRVRALLRRIEVGMAGEEAVPLAPPRGLAVLLPLSSLEVLAELPLAGVEALRLDRVAVGVVLDLVLLGVREGERRVGLGREGGRLRGGGRGGGPAAGGGGGGGG